MKTLKFFVVHIPQRTKDTYTLTDGTEIYVDTKFNEFDHRVTEGEVMCSPLKYDTGVKEGDTLYFHHIVVINNGQPLTGKDNTYVVMYDPVNTINNQAIAYKGDDGEVYTLSSWALTEHIEEEPEKLSEVIEVVELNKKPRTRARIKYLPKDYKGEVKVGDIVGFAANRDYDIDINGEKLFRTRIEDFLYVETN